MKTWQWILIILFLLLFTWLWDAFFIGDLFNYIEEEILNFLKLG